MQASYHQPVLLKASLDGLDICPGGIYVDLTFGGGGHTQALLKRLKQGRVIAFDQDPEAIQQGEKIADPRLTLVQANFRFLSHFLEHLGVKQVNGIIADLGVASYQIDTPERGFSTRYDGRLDMRMNPAIELDAYRLLATYSPGKLRDIFANYGELRRAGAIAKYLVKLRKKNPIRTTLELVDALKLFAPPHRAPRFFAQIFQALRIEVNDELGALADLLPQIPTLLLPQGRLVTIAYHSLEDRMIKYFMRSGHLDDHLIKDVYGTISRPLKPLRPFPKKPTAEEIASNTRARSARLRIAAKIAPEPLEDGE